MNKRPNVLLSDWAHCRRLRGSLVYPEIAEGVPSNLQNASTFWNFYCGLANVTYEPIAVVSVVFLLRMPLFSNTLKEVQKFQTKFWHSDNSDWSFNIGIYENYFYYIELFKEISNTLLKNNIFYFFISIDRSEWQRAFFQFQIISCGEKILKILNFWHWLFTHFQ